MNQNSDRINNNIDIVEATPLYYKVYDYTKDKFNDTQVVDTEEQDVNELGSELNKPIISQTSEEIYSKLGDKTQSENVIIDDVAGRKPATGSNILKVSVGNQATQIYIEVKGDTGKEFVLSINRNDNNFKLWSEKQIDGSYKPSLEYATEAEVQALVERLGLQDQERRPEVEASAILFGLSDQESLVGSKVVRQSAHALGNRPRVLQLAVEKVDRHGELGRGEHLVAALLQQILEREVLTEPLPENPEQISLLDVFFAGEHIGHQIRISLGIPPRERKPQRLKVSTT